MEANIPNINRRKSVHRRNRKVVLRLLLLQLGMLAIASHYARAQLYGIIKYYLLELCVWFLLMCGIVCISDAVRKRRKVRIKRNNREPVEYCPVDEVENVRDEVRVYNYNWIIKDEKKLDIEKEVDTKEIVTKESVAKEGVENKKVPNQVYRSPFDKLEDKDKKVLYKSPFDEISRGRVMIILDSARDDDKYVLCSSSRYKGKFCRVVKDKYVLCSSTRYKGKFCRVVKDKYVLCSSTRYKGKFCRVVKDKYVLCSSAKYKGKFCSCRIK